MGRSAGNQQVAEATMKGITERHLADWEFVVDELYFGKPNFDIAFDDKAYNAITLDRVLVELGI